jgi:predicted nucleic acid-binding protein
MKYCLDTDTIIYFLNGASNKLNRKVKSIKSEEVSSTVINYSELFYGAYNSNLSSKNIKKISDFLKRIEIFKLNKEAARTFSKLKFQLQGKGVSIDDMDLFISSICLSNKLTLVTNNTKHFLKIPKLSVENWL